ncbi:GNAT family N-acetyltransferase [Glycomyces salinus]|uniref:GNAT family N-acetyltransferase n=1 Tax=Glycomyces salinus TaxID=980294 RepID=UPI0035563BDB
MDLFEQLGYPTTPGRLTARLERNATSEYQAWVFEADDRSSIIGFAGGHILHPYEDDAPAAQLMILIVDEQRRGSGAGAALVAVFEQWAQQQGATRVGISSGAERTKAHRFYEGRGYKATGLRFGKRL